MKCPAAPRRRCVCIAGLAALGFGSARAADLAGSSGHVTGSGNMVSQSRSPGSFQAIELRGSMKLVLRQSGREAVQVRADDNLLALIDTVVVRREEGGVLRIDSHGNWSTRRDIVVSVDLLTLKRLAISGSGDALADGLKLGSLQASLSGSGNLVLRQLAADALVAELSGSGDLQASGRAARLQLSMSGSGDVQAAALDADEVRVGIAGSGNASVNARKTLSVDISGSGDVAYSGEALVKSSVSGSGSVHKR